MEQSQENIILQKFQLNRKGYNKDEVDKYLIDIKEKFENNSLKTKELKDEVEELRRVVEKYQEIEKDLRDTLIFLKESERDTLIKTKDQVSAMLNEAEAKSADIVNKAEDEAKSTRDTLLFLKEQQEIFVTRLKIIIDNQEGILNDFKNDDNSPQLKKTMAEAAAFKAQTEMNIDTILEKLL